MLKCHAQVVQVHLQPFRRNSLLQCVSQPKIAEKSLKPPILGVQSHSRSSTLAPIRSLSLLLVMMSSMFVPICNSFHATRDYCGKITTFLPTFYHVDARLRRPP